MRLLIVSQYFYPEDFKINDIAFDFKKKGHDVTVLTAKPNYPRGRFFKSYNFWNKSSEYIDGVKVIRCPIIPRRGGGAFFIILNYLSFVFFGSLYALLAIKNRYDAVFCHLTSPITAALPAIIIKKRFKIPLHIWLLDLWPESVTATTGIKSSLIIRPLEKLVRFIYRQSETIFISSKSFATSIQRLAPSHIHKTRYLPNWAEDVFTNPKPSPGYKLPQMPQGFNIMFAGNVGEAQDFPSILDLVEQTQSLAINWIIVGDGRKLSWVCDQIKQRSLKNIFLMGRHPLEAMPLFFKCADAMLVSLKKDPVFALTVPAKVQAYMASGNIILGMLDGEGQTIINESQAGFCVSSGSTSLLLEKIVSLMQMEPRQRLQIQQMAKRYYDAHFNKEALFDQLESVLENSPK